MENVGLLLRDVSNLEGKVIARAGTRLTPEFMQEVASSGPKKKERVPLLKDRAMLSDLQRTFSEEVYQPVFGSTPAAEKTVEAMSGINVNPAIVKGLFKFKETDFYTYRHCLIVAALATLISPGLPSIYQRSEEAPRVAPGHDIGKLMGPLEVFQKSEALTKKEQALIRSHTDAGFVILTYYAGFESPTCCQVAYEHHERHDGSGYPRGIRLDDELVQLVAVCDTFDALVSSRPYRDAPFDRRAAIDVLCEGAEKGKFDWAPVKLLIGHCRKEKAPLDKIVPSTKKRGKVPGRNLYGVTAN